MTPTRPRDLVIAGLVAAVVAHLLVRFTYSALPTFPLTAGITLAVLGIVEVVAGNLLRARIEHRPGTRPVEALAAARAVIVAKASSLGGAVVAGLWAGLLVYVLPMVGDVVAAGSDARAAGVGLVSALVLVAGGLWLERCCRTPDDPRDEEAGRGPGAGR
ncbi:DUF3180 domain-containing protein [Pseudonocardia benzenivorans]|jgi:hypothetical protein|uniref:Secreted protein n=2 Tax=Pseudonocardia TaxID=1847 RepID=F4CLU2_PSEUX|nr:DUF3180 domain-containing protein [Pseudonocardia dioxanivorans]AEA28224.1 hypothetical protein Psed_6122 [Pseudonocardia dioxanivorans CB1190]GJF02798.1 membrane protein [Pseudonocardia sp. D17]